jgi:hypothetical protein
MVQPSFHPFPILENQIGRSRLNGFKLSDWKV